MKRFFYNLGVLAILAGLCFEGWVSFRGWRAENMNIPSVPPTPTPSYPQSHAVLRGGQPSIRPAYPTPAIPQLPSHQPPRAGQFPTPIPTPSMGQRTPRPAPNYGQPGAPRDPRGRGRRDISQGASPSREVNWILLARRSGCELVSVIERNPHCQVTLRSANEKNFYSFLENLKAEGHPFELRGDMVSSLGLSGGQQVYTTTLDLLSRGQKP